MSIYLEMNLSATADKWDTSSRSLLRILKKKKMVIMAEFFIEKIKDGDVIIINIINLPWSFLK